MKRRAFIAGGAAGAFALLGASAPDTVSVRIDAAPLGKIGPGFAGLSFEKEVLNTELFSSSNTNLVGLFKRLGPSVLRVGANTVNLTTWNANAPGSQPGTIAPADVRRFAGFVEATGWSAIYAVNDKTSNPALAASEAAKAAQALGGALLAFEIGNEPDRYHLSNAEYEARWEQFQTAMHAAVPRTPFIGPSTTNGGIALLADFANAEASKIDTLCAHYYYGDARGPNATIPKMLASSAAPLLQAAREAMVSNHIAAYRIGECNSYYHGGAAGVSDTLASALWGINFLFENVRYGSSGVNFHSGLSSQFPLHYTPIAFSGVAVSEVRPLYYAMLLFTMAGTGNVYGSSVDGSSDLLAYAVESNIVIVNKSAGSSVDAVVTMPRPVAKADVLMLTSPGGLAATTGQTLGGASIALDGTFTPAMTPLRVSDNIVRVSVPAASALLVLTS